MKNAVQTGDVVTLAAPYDVASGAGAQVGILFGVAVRDVASGASGEFALTGVFDLKAASAATATPGAAAYWDNTAKQVSHTDASSANKLIGAFLLTKTNGQTVARVRLNGTTGS